MLFRFEISNILKLYTDYHLSKFQISWLSGSNFMEVSVGYQIFPLFFGNDVIMTSFAYFVEHNISYQPCKFQLPRVSGSNLTEGGRKHPQCCTARKKPSAFRVNPIMPGGVQHHP